MDIKTAARHKIALANIRLSVINLRDIEEPALAGDLEDLLLPLDTLGRVMNQRLEALKNLKGTTT